MDTIISCLVWNVAQDCQEQYHTRTLLLKRWPAPWLNGGRKLRLSFNYQYRMYTQVQIGNFPLSDNTTNNYMSPNDRLLSTSRQVCRTLSQTAKIFSFSCKRFKVDRIASTCVQVGNTLQPKIIYKRLNNFKIFVITWFNKSGVTKLSARPHSKQPVSNEDKPKCRVYLLYLHG